MSRQNGELEVSHNRVLKDNEAIQKFLHRHCGLLLVEVAPSAWQLLPSILTPLSETASPPLNFQYDVHACGSRVGGDVIRLLQTRRGCMMKTPMADTYDGLCLVLLYQ